MNLLLSFSTFDNNSTLLKLNKMTFSGIIDIYTRPILTKKNYIRGNTRKRKYQKENPSFNYRGNEFAEEKE